MDIAIRQGEVVGLLGPNGAGKTTSFAIDCGAGATGFGEGADRWRRYFAHADVPAGRGSIGSAIYAGAAGVPEAVGRREHPGGAGDAAHHLGGAANADGEPAESAEPAHVRKTRGYALSGGERRRVEIARCLAIEPAFILLDEPFSGIDPIAVLDLQQIIFDLKAAGIGVLITDHNVRETLNVTDRAYIINQGVIFRAGTPGELGRDPEVKRIYLGENFSLG